MNMNMENLRDAIETLADPTSGMNREKTKDQALTYLSAVESNLNDLKHRNVILREEVKRYAGKYGLIWSLLYRARNWVHDAPLRQEITEVCPPHPRDEK